MRTQPHYIRDHDIYNGDPECMDPERIIATVHPASDKSVHHVVSQPEGTMDGRSEWVWVRLTNGDLVLGVFPRGDTYFAVEADAQFPGES